MDETMDNDANDPGQLQQTGSSAAELGDTRQALAKTVTTVREGGRRDGLAAVQPPKQKTLVVVKKCLPIPGTPLS